MTKDKCPQCDGSKEIRCNKCCGTGRTSAGGHSNECYKCEGFKKVTCPACAKPKCPNCGLEGEAAKLPHSCKLPPAEPAEGESTKETLLHCLEGLIKYTPDMNKQRESALNLLRKLQAHIKRLEGEKGMADMGFVSEGAAKEIKRLEGCYRTIYELYHNKPFDDKSACGESKLRQICCDEMRQLQSRLRWIPVEKGLKLENKDMLVIDKDEPRVAHLTQFGWYGAYGDEFELELKSVTHYRYIELPKGDK